MPAIGIGVSPCIPGLTPIQRAIAILRKFGQDAHVYLPGIGFLNGLQAGNYLDSAGTTQGTVDQPVGLVKDSFGAIDATQSTTPAKPVLRRGAVNLALHSHDLSSTDWVLEAGATKSGQTLICASDTMRVWQGSTVTGAQTFALLLSGSGTCSVFGYNGVDGAGGNFALTQITLTPTPTLYAVPYTTTVGATGWRFGRWVGDTATSITFGAGAVFQGTYTASQIQALGGIPLTLTAPVSTTLGAYWWEFDGVDDSLALSGPLFQMSDDWCVTAGMRCDEQGNWRTIFAQDGAGGVPRLSLVCANGDIAAVLRNDAGAMTQLLYAYTRGLSYVVTMRKVGTTVVLRVNGVQVASNVAPASPATFTGFAMGKLSNGTGDYFTGGIYELTAIKATLSDADVLTLERLVGNLAGVTI